MRDERCRFCLSARGTIPDDNGKAVRIHCHACGSFGPWRETMAEAWEAFRVPCPDCAKLKEAIPDADTLAEIAEFLDQHDRDRANTLLGMVHAIREVVIP